MGKDPAILLYIDKWITATQGMRAEAKGWYLELILYQFDKGSLPNDLDELAAICRIRPSEFDLFKQVFEQVLKHKFKQTDEGTLENDFANEILQKRQRFVEKRSNAGKLSYVLKYYRKNFKMNKGLEQYIKDNIDLNFDIKDEQVLKQVFKQKSELYINVNEDINIDTNKDINIVSNIIEYLNKKANKNFRTDTDKTIQVIKARLKEGFSIDDIKRVIDIKVKDWLHKDDMNVFLRPETLFGNKFEGYLNSKPNKTGSHNQGSALNKATNSLREAADKTKLKFK